MIAASIAPPRQMIFRYSIWHHGRAPSACIGAKNGAKSMPLHDTLQTILTDYAAAKDQPFAHHPLGVFIRHAAAEAVKETLGELGAGLQVEGSAGAGNWAAVPWISIFDLP
jgi:hypothetical protein